MHSDLAVVCQAVSKTYRIFGHPGDRIKQAFSLGHLRRHDEFTALRNISFDIRRGETVGIIGRNGSGKSTLLQLICGILTPTQGKLNVSGRVSALLELGAGFNPEFTGRENIYFQGAIMGFDKRAMDARLEAILAFAEIGSFIDQPVRTYSSGMFVRLAFSVAVHIDPEILVIDEALGVGDAEFQERSITRMKELQASGATIFLVSHSLPLIRNFCQRAIWLDGGDLRLSGPASSVCQAYEDEVSKPSAGTFLDLSAGRLYPSGRTKTISITAVHLNETVFAVGSSLTLSIELAFAPSAALPKFGVGVIVRNEVNRIVAIFNTLRDSLLVSGEVKSVTLELPRNCFVPGRYTLSVNVCDTQVLFAFDELDRCLSFEVLREVSTGGLPRWEGEVACEHAWHW